MQARQQRPGACAAGLLAPAPRRSLSSSAAPRRCRRRRLTAVVVVAAAPIIETDAAARVAGTPAAVADYLSRVDETWPAWYPRLASARRIDGGSFEVVVRAAGGAGGLLPAIDLPVTVRLLERSGKRVAFSASSPFHEAREQYVLMPCPADPRGGHTAVRHLSEVRLRGAWAGPLAAPVVGAVMRAAPREALARLEGALRAEEQRRRHEEQRQRQQRQGGRSKAAAGAGAAGGQEGGGGSGSFWQGLFGGSGRASSSASSSSSPSPNGDIDTLGFYAALGLDPRALPPSSSAVGGSSGGPADADADALIKAAFRQRAKLLHPDANVGAGAADAERLRGEYFRVQRAYLVLRDAEARRRYDRGEWQQDGGDEATDRW